MNSASPVQGLFVCASLALAASAEAHFTYAFFFGPSLDITTQGPAGWNSTTGAYDLTTGGDSSGAMWHNTRQNIRGGFVTTFQFRINPGQVLTGDGFAFVVHDDPAGNAARGGGGSSVGYGPGFTGGGGPFTSISRAIAVEFDTFGFSGELDVPHVSIQGMNTSGECDAGDNFSFASADLTQLGIDILDGNSHIATVQYKPEVPGDPPIPARIEVWVDDVFACGADLDLGFVPVDPTQEIYAAVYDDDLLSNDYATAWVGFTAGTGLADSNHTIEAWAFDGGTSECQSAYWWLAGNGSGCFVPDGPCSMGMEVLVQGTRPITYTWLRNGQLITDDEGGRLVGLDRRHLEINPATGNDSAYYRAEFWNACGSGTWGDVFIVPFIYCNDIDFNNDGLFPDTADLDEFLNIFGGGACSGAGYGCDPIDFNNDGLFPDTLDIDAFLSMFGGGACLR